MSSSLHLSHFRSWLRRSPPVEWGIQQLRELLLGAVRQGPVPQHVAFVMDGNRRFARNHQIETIEGHNLGFEALARILEVCYKSGIRVVTIYAFSIENFKRSKYEVGALMDMAKVKLSQLAQHGELLDRYGAKIQFLGQKDMVRPDVLEAIEKACEMTSGNGKAILNICAPYTSRDEITTAIRQTVISYSQPTPPPLKRPFSESHITRNIRAQHLSTVAEEAEKPSPPPTTTAAPSTTAPEIDGVPPAHQDYDHEDAASTPSLSPNPSTSTTLASQKDSRHSSGPLPDPETITAETLTAHTFTGASTPPLDLLIRTSGVERLSDFMLWQCHENTDIVFLECMWPEFDIWRFLPVLLEWQWRKRKENENGAAGRRAGRRRKKKEE